MFTKIRNLVAYAKDLLDKCLHEPEVNSRLVFLTNSLVIHVVVLWQTFAYIHNPVKDANYISILGVCLGAHGVNGLGRLMTKRVGENSNDADKG